MKTHRENFFEKNWMGKSSRGLQGGHFKIRLVFFCSKTAEKTNIQVFQKFPGLKPVEKPTKHSKTTFLGL